VIASNIRGIYGLVFSNIWASDFSVYAWYTEYTNPVLLSYTGHIRNYFLIYGLRTSPVYAWYTQYTDPVLVSYTECICIWYTGIYEPVVFDIRARFFPVYARYAEYTDSIFVSHLDWIWFSYSGNSRTSISKRYIYQTFPVYACVAYKSRIFLLCKLILYMGTHWKMTKWMSVIPTAEYGMLEKSKTKTGYEIKIILLLIGDMSD